MASEQEREILLSVKCRIFPFLLLSHAASYIFYLPKEGLHSEKTCSPCNRSYILWVCFLVHCSFSGQIAGFPSFKEHLPDPSLQPPTLALPERWYLCTCETARAGRQEKGTHELILKECVSIPNPCKSYWGQLDREIEPESSSYRHLCSVSIPPARWTKVMDQPLCLMDTNKKQHERAQFILCSNLPTVPVLIHCRQQAEPLPSGILATALPFHTVSTGLAF